jgi:hypothetical protein
MPVRKTLRCPFARRPHCSPHPGSGITRVGRTKRGQARRSGGGCRKASCRAAWRDDVYQGVCRLEVDQQ